uniref:Uncharacterized protein n=1 Tax=Arundo donax TaxID=35708 RepID=A0A0A9HV73_ARUDO
MNLKCLIVVD